MFKLLKNDLNLNGGWWYILRSFLIVVSCSTGVSYALKLNHTLARSTETLFCSASLKQV